MSPGTARCASKVVGAVALVIALAACSDGGNNVQPVTVDAPVTTTVAAQSTTTASGNSDGDAPRIEKTFVRFLRAWEAAAAEPVTPDAPELVAVTTSDAHEDLREALTFDRTAGLATRGPGRDVRVDDVILSSDGTRRTATLRACVRDAQVVYRVADGSVVNDEVSVSLYEVDLEQREDGSWVVSGADGRAGTCEWGDA